MQEITCSTLASRGDLGVGFLPPNTRSIPTHLNNPISPIESSGSNTIARSSSQPPEIWFHEETETTKPPFKTPMNNESEVDITQIRSYIISNRSAVLAMLGIDVNEHTKHSEMRKSKTSTDDFIYGGSSTVWGESKRNFRPDTESIEAHNQPIKPNGDLPRLRKSSSRSSQHRQNRETSSSNNSSASSLHLAPLLVSNNDVLNPETINNRHRMDQESRRHSRRDSNISYRSIGSDHMQIKYETDYQPEDNERSSLISNEVRQNNESKVTHNFSRNHQHNSRSNASFRFSAGDADNLEKGIRHIPSTRSLKD